MTSASCHDASQLRLACLAPAWRTDAAVWFEWSLKVSPLRGTLIPGAWPGVVEQRIHFAPPVRVSPMGFCCDLSDFQASQTNKREGTRKAAACGGNLAAGSAPVRACSGPNVSPPNRSIPALTLTISQLDGVTRGASFTSHSGNRKLGL